MTYSRRHNFGGAPAPEPDPVPPAKPTITVSGPTYDQHDKLFHATVYVTPKSGDTITDRVVEFRKSGSTTWTRPEVKQDFARIDVLASGSTYEFRAYVVNKAGSSPVSDTITRSTPVTVPATPTGLTVSPLNKSLYVSWKPLTAAGNPDTVNVYVTPTAGGSPFHQVVDAKDTDAIVDQLTNGAEYSVQVSASSREYVTESPKSAAVKATPAPPNIPAPVLKELKPGDGYATAVFTPVTPPEGYTIDHYSYRAVDKSGQSPDVEEHIEGTPAAAKLALPNDVTWTVTVLAFVAPGDIPGDESNALDVHPEIPVAPYPPHITGASIDAGNAGMIDVSFVPGTSNDDRLGPFDITAWQVEVDPGKPEAKLYDLTDPEVRKFRTEKVGIGTHEVVVRAKNSVGWSPNSVPVAVTYKPTETRPFTSDKAFREWTDADGYSYAIFDPGNDPKDGPVVKWTLTRTSVGADVLFEVICCGAGGGGKGTTITGGKGGDGGGGEWQTTTLTPQPEGSKITVTAGLGGFTAIDPNDTRVEEGSRSCLAKSGKSASDKNDADGFPRSEIPAQFQKCSTFSWHLPESKYVGGVCSPGEQEYPNGFQHGEAGAGTKGTKPGQGQEGIAVLRWKL